MNIDDVKKKFSLVESPKWDPNRKNRRLAQFGKRRKTKPLVKRK